MTFLKEKVFILSFFSLICFSLTIDSDLFNTLNVKKKLDECDVCISLNESFNKGLKETERENFDGGDPNWIEKKVFNYANSELRLTEIQENLCLELSEGKDQCLALAEENEEIIENWWFSKKENNPNLYTYLCIDKLKKCCPPGHYGKDCIKCKGFPDNICNKNGECIGSGTRKGNGECKCKIGYEGKDCLKCSINFVDVDNTCLSCDSACKNGCKDLSPKGCNECENGFIFDDIEGCKDIDECKNQTICEKKSTFCVNNYGSYSCLDCDKSCSSCHGPQSSDCKDCSKGFIKEKSLCIPYKESVFYNNREIFKYLLYVAITIVSCYMMKRHPLLSLLITIFLSVFIGLNEYANLNSLDSVTEAVENFFLN